MDCTAVKTVVTTVTVKVARYYCAFGMTANKHVYVYVDVSLCVRENTVFVAVVEVYKFFLL